MRTVVAVQVVPFIDFVGEVRLQPAGPTAETSGWGIYERLKNGFADWVADTRDETMAMLFGEHLANFHAVPIEHQAWKVSIT